MKLWQKIALVTVIAVVTLGVMFKVNITKMEEQFAADYNSMVSIPAAALADGVYNGSYGKFVVHASVEVTIKDQMFTSVKIIDRKCGKGYEAEEMTDNIMKTQQTKADVVTGASSTSKAIVLAVQNAVMK